MSQPALGEVIHYRSSFGHCCAALVKAPVNRSGRLEVEVFPPGYRSYSTRVFHSESKANGTWHWPCEARS